MNYSRMSDEELVGCYQDPSVSEKKKNEIMDQMVSRYHDVIKRLAAPYFLVGGDRSDLIQEGFIGLAGACGDYDPEKNDKFYPFAVMCIERAELKAVNKYNRKKYGPLNDSVSIDDEDITKPFVKGPEEIILGSMDVEDKITSLFGELSTLETNVLKLMMDGYDYKEIAGFLNRPEKSIDNTIQRIRKKAKKHLAAPSP